MVNVEEEIDYEHFHNDPWGRGPTQIEKKFKLQKPYKEDVDANEHKMINHNLCIEDLCMSIMLLRGIAFGFFQIK